MLDLIKNKNSKKEAAKRRGGITRKITELSPNIKNSTITTISNSDLKLLFELYDRCFFKNVFRDSFKGKFKFSLSRRMTKSAGKTICPKNIDKINPEELVIEIRIGVDFTFEGKKMSGILYNINKRATVMVRDKNGQYSDKKGTRYTKYYVPLSQFD